MKTALLFILMTLVVSAAKPKDVTLADVRAAYLEREKVVTKEIADARAQLPAGAGPGDPFPEKGRLREGALFHLRFLTQLERTLRIAVIDDATRTAQLASEFLPSGEQRRIVELWAELQAARFLQLAPPADQKKNRRKRGGAGSVEVALNERFESKSRSLVRKIEQVQKRLDTAFSKERSDDRLIDSLDKEIDSLKAQLEEIRLAYFGSPVTGGFETPYEAVGDDPTEKLLAEVVTSRDALLLSLRGDGLQKKEGGKGSGTIGEMVVQSENLGVILDASGSMQSFLKPLKEEIDQEFSHAHYREVNGCALTWEIDPTSPKQDANMLAMEDLLIVQKADAIFWFSDLNDAQTPQALARLKWLLETSRARLHVNSVKNKPSRELEPLVAEFRKK